MIGSGNGEAGRKNLPARQQDHDTGGEPVHAVARTIARSPFVPVLIFGGTCSTCGLDLRRRKLFIVDGGAWLDEAYLHRTADGAYIYQPHYPTMLRPPRAVGSVTLTTEEISRITHYTDGGVKCSP